MTQPLLSQIVNPALNSTIGNITNSGNFSVGLQTFLRNLLNVALGLGGLFFFVNLLRGGFEYINAGGDKDKVHQAYERIKNSLMGVVIIFSVFAIIFIVETVFGLSIRNVNIPNLI
jgi:hypothetical protein